MAQLVTRIDDDLATELDHLVHEGVFESRSAAVRAGLRALIDQQRRRRDAAAIVQAYTDRPQTDDELGWADAAAIRMIADEPW
jgi:Arc/MetJ-type ribon-helix-helix transcriptional regulator